MALWVREEEPSASRPMRRPQDKRTGMPSGPRGVIGASTITNLIGQFSALANIVEDVFDWDIPDGNIARSLATKVLPSTTPYVIVQYRVPMGSSRTFGCVRYQHQHYRHVATRAQTGVVTIRPSGPLGAVIVRFRPEAAARFLGERMQDFADAKIGLGDVFNASDISLLEEMVSEAPSSTERAAHVLRFLLTNAHQREPDPVACRAAALLRRIPSLRVRRIAAELGISERHLSRRFQTVFGMSPKQFSRIARIEKVLAARNGGSAWADVAYTCGFSDQAHMINDFNAIVGAPPEHVLRPPSIEQHHRLAVPRGQSISHSLG